MPARKFFAEFVFALLCSCAVAVQQPEERAAGEPAKAALDSGIDRVSGIDSGSNIHYVRLILPGSLRSSSSADSPAPLPGPTLIAQCTLKANGKSSFELFANFGG